MVHDHFYDLGIRVSIAQDICETGLSGRNYFMCNSGASTGYFL